MCYSCAVVQLYSSTVRSFVHSPDRIFSKTQSSYSYETPSTCIHVHMYTCKHIYAHLHGFTHMFTHFHTFTRIYTHYHTFSHIFTFPHFFTHFHTFAHICTYIHTFLINTHVHTYTHMYTHLHTHTQTHRDICTPTHTLRTYAHTPTHQHTYTPTPPTPLHAHARSSTAHAPTHSTDTDTCTYAYTDTCKVTPLDLHGIIDESGSDFAAIWVTTQDTHTSSEDVSFALTHTAHSQDFLSRRQWPHVVRVGVGVGGAAHVIRFPSLYPYPCVLLSAGQRRQW